MRLIGTIEGDKQAATFSDFLYVKGIENRVEREQGERYEVWVVAEEQLEEASSLLQTYLANPTASEYAQVASAAKAKLARELEEQEAAAEKMIDSRDIVQRQRSGPTYLTILLIVISVAVAFMSNFGDKSGVLQAWHITEYDQVGNQIEWSPGLPEVMHGQVWRLVTPIFIHYGFMHLFFNMYWLLYLGTMIERSLGSWYLFVLVVISAALSNYAQYAIHLHWMHSGGPSFGGMSGVLYALFGFCWMKSKYDFASGIMIHPNTVAMMMIWFFLCLTGLMPVANMAHTGGLVVGLAWGYVSARSNWIR